MDRDELVRYLDAYLRIQDFPQDPSLNGLQVEGKRTVRKVGAAVDAGEAIFRKALEEEVDFLIVHHGLFWGKPFPIVGHHKRRLETLFQGGINLYAAHLPLDAHEEVGNNFVLARELGLVDLTPWDVGVKGRFPQPTPLLQVADRLGQEVIEFVGVTKSFGDRVLIDNLSFTVPAGAIVGIIGPNGAGKSTLFKLISGKEQPDSGEVRLARPCAWPLWIRTATTWTTTKPCGKTSLVAWTSSTSASSRCPVVRIAVVSTSTVATSKRRLACCRVVSAAVCTWPKP